MMGKKTQRIFPAGSLAAVAIQTATQTRRLHKTPRMRAGRKPSEALLAAVETTASDMEPRMPPREARRAIKTAPKRLPR